MSDKIVALLPMKANSERVVGKNFRDFNGKPLFRWILDTLLSVGQRFTFRGIEKTWVFLDLAIQLGLLTFDFLDAFALP